jgi:hypothetical protein
MSITGGTGRLRRKFRQGCVLTKKGDLPVSFFYFITLLAQFFRQ